MNTKSKTSPATSPGNRALLDHARFPLGQVAATPGALELLEQHRVSLFDLLARHAKGDWGDVGAEDAHANDQALIHGYRLLSCYTLVPGDSDTRVWVISEADRSVTTALKPEEY
jgi:hypothetical protein